MQFSLVPTARIEREWPAFAERLLPAVRQEPNASLRGAYDKLTCGSAVLFEVFDGADGLLMVSASEDEGQPVAWVYAIVGRINGRPKERLQAMREALGIIENVARDAGCVAIRICGRDYSRMFPEYRPFDGPRNGLEKAL